MILLALKLAAGRAWDVIKGIPLTWVALALAVIVAAFCWHGWHREHVGRVADVAKLIDAGKRATDAQAALVAKIEAANLKTKETADAKLPVESARADAAARDYVRLHRAPSCGPGNTDRAESAPAAEVADGTDRTAVLVPEADVMICTANTTRLLNAQEWAQALGN